MRICDDLRRAVLQAAIQGKLTKQMPEDGNASDLLKKNLSLIENDENLFDIPLSWKWVKLGDIGSFTRGSGIKRNEVTSDGYPCIRYGQLYTTYHNIISEVQSKTSETVFNKSKKIKHGDLVMALTGENNYDIALACAYTGNEIVAIGGDMTAFTHNVNPLYLVIAINSPYGIKCKSKLATGNIIVHISNDKLASIPFPLPPLAEQQRIVSRVEELMARIDDLEKTETELEKLKAAFPGDMKAALLQAAMQGKLTEQLPEDGDAGEQINNIFAKKESYLWEKGKKKVVLRPTNEKDLNIFTPKNWKVIRLGQVVSILGRIGFRGFTKSDFTDKTGAISLSPGNLLPSNKMTFKSCSYIKWEKYNESPEIQIQNGDLLLVKTGSSYGKCAVVENLPKEATINPQLARIVSHGINISFLRFVFSSPFAKSQFESFVTGTATPTFPKEKIENFVLPFPPLEEQKRIVEKLDKLLPLCDGLIEK